LGERLGFSNIKIALPTEITTGKKYIQLYIEAILSIQRDAEVRQRRPVTIPLAIMTSGDTHARTVRIAFFDRVSQLPRAIEFHAFAPLEALPHACDQWHSSRVFAPLTGLHYVSVQTLKATTT
jgi:hypothetical protein